MSYIYDSWTVSKKKIAYYSFKSTTRYKEVEDFVVQDAINQLKAKLNSYKKDLYNRVDKTDSTLNMAIIYFAVCQINRAGLSSTTSGTITGESIDGMSVSYSSPKSTAQIKAPIPNDPCDRAVDLVNNYIREKFRTSGKYGIIAANRDDLRFNGTYNKRTRSTNWIDE